MTDNLVLRSRRNFAGLRWSVTRRALRRINWSSLTRDVLWSASKIDENYFFLAFRLVIIKLVKPSFFVAYSQLCRHCLNLTEGGCLFSPFHFTLCSYFLGHVACRNLPRQGLLYAKTLNYDPYDHRYYFWGLFEKLNAWLQVKQNIISIVFPE